VGELGFTFCPVDAAICSVAYWMILVKGKNERENAQKVAPVKSIPIS
jgi:hypothetical protein